MIQDIVPYRWDKYESRDSDWLLTDDACGKLSRERRFSANFRRSFARLGHVACSRSNSSKINGLLATGRPNRS